MSRRVLAAGLLCLALVAACADDRARPSTALAPATAPSPDAVLTTVGPEPVASSGASAPSVAAAAPAVRATTAVAVAPPPAPEEPSAQPAAEPAPARTATKTAAPAPSRSAEPAPAQADQYALTIEDFAFSPRVLTVPAGSTVTATNRDDTLHDWTSDRGVWASGDLRQGQSFSFTFQDVGKYDFLCERHPSMTGTVNVVPRQGGAR